MWYGGSVDGGIYLDLKDGHWDDLKKLATELHEMIPVFLSPTVDPPTVEPKEAKISVMLKRFEDHTVLLACNRSTQPVDVVFHSPAIHADKVKVLYEDREIQSKDGGVADTFQPLQVHVYQLP
jgi:hypothetical protein